jgi:hypothetical protein
MKRRRRGGAVHFHKVFALVRHRANLPDAAPGMGRGRVRTPVPQLCLVQAGITGTAAAHEAAVA